MKLWQFILLMGFGITMMVSGLTNLARLSVMEYGKSVHIQVCNDELTKAEAARELRESPFTEIAVEGYKSLDCNEISKLADEL